MLRFIIMATLVITPITGVVAQGGGIANASVRGNERGEACSKAIDKARIFVPSGSEVTNVKCECAIETGATADALGKWSCTGLVSYNSPKK